MSTEEDKAVIVKILADYARETAGYLSDSKTAESGTYYDGEFSPEEIADKILETGFERGCRCYPLDMFNPERKL